MRFGACDGQRDRLERRQRLESGRGDVFGPVLPKLPLAPLPSPLRFQCYLNPADAFSRPQQPNGGTRSRLP